MTAVLEAGPNQPARTRTTALGRLADHCYDRRRLVLTRWVLALIGITVLAQVVGTHFQNRFTSGDTPDVVFHTTAPVTDAANRAAIAVPTLGVEAFPPLVPASA